MKILILLVFLASCASKPDYEELFYECEIERQGSNLKSATKAFEVSLKELKEAVCRDYKHDEVIQDEFCNDI